jgi:hypothetical protein
MEPENGTRGSPYQSFGIVLLEHHCMVKRQALFVKTVQANLKTCCMTL